MLASSFKMPYRVLRCAAATGAEVYVLGNAAAHGLRFSRYCQTFFDTAQIVNGSRDDNLVHEINTIAENLDLALVMPSDPPTTRALIASRDLIALPCFPLPKLEEFDRLNDKWSFAELCACVHIRCPTTRLYPDIAALAEVIEMEKLRRPVMVKPLSSSGNQGVYQLTPEAWRDQLRSVKYRPILLQDFIEGRDIGASVYARNGKIAAFIAHDYERRVYRTFQHEGMFRSITDLLARTSVTGVLNFDMRMTDSGEIFFLECNPRFFFKIDLSMIAGINFVEMGLCAVPSDRLITVPDGTTVRYPSAVLTSPRNWLRVSRSDWSLLIHTVRDPRPFLLEEFRLVA